MTPFFSSLPFVAGMLSLIVAACSLLPRNRSAATWLLFAGMSLLGVDGLLAGFSLRSTQVPEALGEFSIGLTVKALAATAWLGFSLTYSRGDYREVLARWRVHLAIFALLPIALALGFQQHLFQIVVAEAPNASPILRLGPAGKAVNALLVMAYVGILMNLEHTFRAAVGMSRWRIKFVVLGLAVIFGARLYVRSQALLFSAYDAHWPGIESSATLIGCGFLVIAGLRAGFAESEVYPSRALLRHSLTVFIAGGYLFLVGVLANALRKFGGTEHFQAGAFVLLLGMAGLGVLLLSDRLRQRIHWFVDRHFARAQHDSIRTWAECSRRLARVMDQADLCVTSASLVSEIFQVLSVTTWVLEAQSQRLVAGAATAATGGAGNSGDRPRPASAAVLAALRSRVAPFDLEGVNEPWAEEFRTGNPATFLNGGHRWCVPLRAGEQCLGAVVLADRVNGADYTLEDLQLLRCIADQVTSVLLNLQLADEVARAREMEAFRTMSAFFVHDLKNTAASLHLMLKNAQAHFDDPAFRADALRGIGNTARRIEELIGRLAALRQRPEFRPVEADLNQLVSDVLQTFEGAPEVELTKDLRPLPSVLADRDQIRSAVANLLLNARDAVGSGGRIRVRTEHAGARVVLTVADDGCGMSAAFVRDSLFCPFRSTKNRGLGIGMYQTRMIVEAHGGAIRVESEPGEGSTFQVSLPVKDR